MEENKIKESDRKKWRILKDVKSDEYFRNLSSDFVYYYRKREYFSSLAYSYDSILKSSLYVIIAFLFFSLSNFINSEEHVTIVTTRIWGVCFLFFGFGYFFKFMNELGNMSEMSGRFIVFEFFNILKLSNLKKVLELRNLLNKSKRIESVKEVINKTLKFKKGKKKKSPWYINFQFLYYDEMMSCIYMYGMGSSGTYRAYDYEKKIRDGGVSRIDAKNYLLLREYERAIGNQDQKILNKKGSDEIQAIHKFYYSEVSKIVEEEDFKLQLSDEEYFILRDESLKGFEI